MSVTDPSGSDIQQSETPDVQSVPVTVETPVRVHPLGAISWSTRKFTPDNTGAVQVLRANPRRSRALITVRSQIAYLSSSQAGATPDTGVILSSPSSFELRHTQEAWIIGGNAAASEIGVIEEYWSS